MPSPIHYEPIFSDQDHQDSDTFQFEPGDLGQWSHKPENTRLDSAPSTPELDADVRHISAKAEFMQAINESKQLETLPALSAKPPWRDPVRWCMWGNVAVLAINIVFTIVAVGVAASKGNNHGFGSITIYEGSCKTIQYMKIGLHLLLNVLSVAMTATSSYCCSILIAPSRSDVDEAHAMGKWLSIGVSSWRNFWNLKARSQVLWISLLATSIIIQMVYNSVVYSSVNANSYQVFVAPYDFVSNTSVPTSYYEDKNCFPESYINWNMTHLREAILNGTFEYLSKEDCLSSYATSYVSNRRTVVLVTKEPLSGDAIPLVGYGYPGGITGMDPAINLTKNIFQGELNYGQSNVGFDWMCYADLPHNGGCSSSFLTALGGNWNVTGQALPRETKVDLYNFNSTSDIEIDRWVLTAMGGHFSKPLNETGINWTNDEIKDFLAYVKSNPTEEQMWTYINHTSWVNSVWDYTNNSTKIVQADGSTASPRGDMNVSTWCPQVSNLETGEGEVEVSVDHCLSQKSDGACGLFYQLPIAFTAIMCGVVKVICMLLLLRIGRHELLLTIGDAISSFLQRPDPTTRNWCTLSSEEVLKNKECPWNPSNKCFEKADCVPQEYHPAVFHTEMVSEVRRINGEAVTVPTPRKHHWGRAGSGRVWMMTLVTMIVYIVISVLLPLLATKNQSTHPYEDSSEDTASLRDIWNIKGWGETESTSLLSSYVGTFLGSILLANTPQLVVSFLYYCLNDHLTRYLIAADYRNYSVVRRPLRVSFPQGEQRSTFYLSVPYKYAIPLLTGFTLVHWFVSEGSFYVQVLPYNLDYEPVISQAIVTCGVSTNPLISGLLLTVVMFFAILILGGRRLKHSKMPLLNGMSVIVSAACHPPSYDSAAAFKAVQWGVVKEHIDAESPHCTFSSLKVEEPDEDVQYA